MANDTIPTRMYSSGVFVVPAALVCVVAVRLPTRMYLSSEYIAYLPFLQALTAFGEADEREKRDNSYDNDN